MNQLTIKRLQKELQQLKQHPDENISLKPHADNIKEWTGTLTAPLDSYYCGHEFDIVIKIPIEYPLSPPLISFATKIFHPNVKFDTGELCLDILKKEWSPAWNLQSAARAIIALLSEPSADSPLNCDAGNILRAGDSVAFRSMARMYCKENCRPLQSET